MTYANLLPVHCQSTHAKNEKKSEKAVLDGMWVSVIIQSSKEDLKKYFENSKNCMTKVLPNVIRKKSFRI